MTNRIVLLALVLSLAGCASDNFVDQVASPTVRIETDTGRGTGVVFFSDDNGSLILTANHVVRLADKVFVDLFTFDRNGRLTKTDRVEGQVVARSSEDDLALILISEKTPFRVRLLPPDKTLRVGQSTWAYGCPLGLDPIPTVGIISSLDVLRSSADIFPGNSGGGLFVREGGEYFLIGVTQATLYYGGQFVCHYGVYITVEKIRAFLEQQNLGYVLK